MGRTNYLGMRRCQDYLLRSFPEIFPLTGVRNEMQEWRCTVGLRRQT